MIIVFLFIFHIPPDLMKGMLLGTIKAIGIQYKAKYVNLLGQGCLYFSAFYYHNGLWGIMISKIFLEYFIFSGYLTIITTSDWEKIASEAK